MKLAFTERNRYKNNVAIQNKSLKCNAKEVKIFCKRINHDDCVPFYYDNALENFLACLS